MADDVQEITGGNWKIAARLCNFVTAQAFLLPRHQEWLDTNLKPTLRSLKGPWVDLIGYASRIGSTQFNQDLSERRCKAVRDHVAKYQSDINFRFNVDLGKGESESGPDESDNSGYYRAVDLYAWGFKPPPLVRIPVPRLKPIGVVSDRFSIRLLGQASVGKLVSLAKLAKWLKRLKGLPKVGVAADAIFFEMRDLKNHLSGFYFYTGFGVGAGAFLVSTTHMGPWNDFTTSKPIRVSQFAGLTRFTTGGAGKWTWNGGPYHEESKVIKSRCKSCLQAS